MDVGELASRPGVSVDGPFPHGVAAHESEWPGVEAVARQGGVSAGGLQRLFRSALGLSVFEYRRLARLERARDMLAISQCATQEAASLSGYSRAANFATAFRRQFGATPNRCSARRDHEPVCRGRAPLPENAPLNGCIS
mgnify:CR=1 FL=1